MPTTTETRQIEEAAAVAALDDERFDTSLTPHILTDKPMTKVLPCMECRRPCVVTTFLQPQKCLCRDHKGESSGPRAIGSQHAVIAGRTPAEYAVNLPDALINKEFMSALCPFGPEHIVRLKDIGHSPNYGPRQLLGYKDGIPQYKQEIGEVATLQCADCNTVIQFSTQHPRQLRPVNAPKQSARTEEPLLDSMLGHEDDEEEAV